MSHECVDNCAENKHINPTNMRCPILVLLLLHAVSGLYAQEDDLMTNALVGLTSRHVFRGVEHAGAGAEGTFQVARDGWRMGAEFSQPFDRNEPGEGILTAAYAWKATKQFKVEALVMPRWSIETPPSATSHSVEAGLSASWELPKGVVLELTGLHDWRLKGNTLQMTLNYSLPLENLGAYLEWSASAGISSAHDLRPDALGLPIHDAYTYYGASVRLPYRISSNTTVVGGLHVAESDNQSRFWSPIAAPGGVHAWVDLSLSFDF